MAKVSSTAVYQFRSTVVRPVLANSINIVLVKTSRNTFRWSGHRYMYKANHEILFKKMLNKPKRKSPFKVIVMIVNSHHSFTNWQNNLVFCFFKNHTYMHQFNDRVLKFENFDCFDWKGYHSSLHMSLWVFSSWINGVKCRPGMSTFTLC